jgi:hypothetical protein
MILRIGGLMTLIDGINAALSIDNVDTENKEGKFEFWYQRRNIESSATA